MTRHTALDRLRLEARRPLLSDSRDPDTIWPSLPDMYENTDEALWRSLYLAVHSLPEQQRQVLELTYYQGMSHSEIAKELG